MVIRLTLACVAQLLVNGLDLQHLAAEGRVEDGLLALYDFTADAGATVHDRSDIGTPLDLTIDKPASVTWLQSGLAIQSHATISSAQPATKIISAIKKSGALTIEAWMIPANTSQSGPARIVSLSGNPSQRNVTLGQEQDLFDVRLRTSSRDKNGLPSTAGPKGSARPQLTHVVFARNAKGSTGLYVNGKQVADQKVDGNLGNWDGDYRLLLANEATSDRPWLGELHLVAIFDRALSADDIQQNFTAGAQRSEPDPPSPATISAAMFDSQVAPLFAKHCLECHDPAIKKGGLDLSQQATALLGGESGPAISPGKSSASLLWELVKSDEMPKERAPLSPEEKSALQAWLDSGAVYSVDRIDPAIYAHGGGATDIWVQRLTVSEYISTVRAAVGVEITREAHELLPPDLRADGFRNTAYNLSVDLMHVDAYARLAELITRKMDVLKFAARFSQSTKLSTDDTMRDHVAAMGKWLFRGPLDDREINAYCGIATTIASAGGDFQEAMSYIVEAMLQSPRFIYRIERQPASGRPRTVGPYELASRMSYIVWGAPPDDDLLQAADRGDLADRTHVQAQIQRMLKDPRAVDRSTEFAAEWLNLERLDNMRPDRQRFPNWDPQLAQDMREETLAFFREVVWKEQRPLSDLLNAQFTFATPALARHYGLPPVGNDLARYDLTSIPGRGGLLTQGSVLTIGGDGASMVSRGLFVLHDLLRGTINAPPPCVNTTPPPTKAGLTQRGIAELRIADAKCGVCHARFEPLAFGLEKFDGVGAYHELDEHRNPLRDDGEILFPGTAKPVAYQTSAELMKLLADSERVQSSLTWKVTQFALGRPLSAADAPVVTEIHKASQSAGGTYSALVTAIVMSDLVQMTAAR